MIAVYKTIHTISSLLNDAIGKHVFDKYKLILDANNQITVYLKGIKKVGEVSKLEKEWEDVNFERIEQDDDTYDFMFQDGDTVDIHSSRLRLNNLLSGKCQRIETSIPVVSFYSYKGGVGRSTTMASFASFLSVKKGLKVCVLDCDLEAPGFTNFFQEEPQNIYYKNGLVEYFIDSSTNSMNSLSSYYWETSKKFSGEGAIYVFPSGNLSCEFVEPSCPYTHLDHYLNGLSRLNTFHSDFLVEEFKKLFVEINNELKPNVILIDCRTGFNDIFGISAFRLSDIVVGFFGIDSQSKPGLSFFLKTLFRENSPRVILANSIIPSFAKSRLFKEFKTYSDEIMSHLQTENDENERGLLSVKTFPIGYNEVLNNIGLPTSSYEDYISLIKNSEFTDYTNLFNCILDYSNDLKSHSQNKDGIDEFSIFSHISETNGSTKMSLKKKILDNVLEFIPNLYAESIRDFDQEYKSNRYFYRRCMEDLFNADKFIVMGNKGTGKTYIYKSLVNKNIVCELRKRANKQDIEYEFVQIINSNHRFDTVQLDNMVDGFPLNLFYERFWKIYIWNVLLSSHYDFIPKSDDLFPIKNDTVTAQKFVKCIKDDQFIVQIEKDLASIDNILLKDKSCDRRIVLIFDELDNIVKPHLWTERISPLINYCRKLQYACISPKLFLRSDLFNKTSNINNRNELNNRTIHIEWGKDELFAYFFKFVLSHSKNEFFEFMRQCDYYPNFFINKTIRKIESEGNQPLQDEYVLHHLCATFFGKYADSNQSAKYGESYDWFYNNLKNADDTISLRPFIDLIHYAAQDAKNDDTLDSPVLPSKYFTGSKVRVKAVEHHFRDLSDEQGNMDLKQIFEFIRQMDGTNMKFKRVMLPISIFSEMAEKILNSCNLEDTHDIDSMIQLLLVNGIAKEQFIRKPIGSVRCIQFALLYKYYLGLSSRKY